MTIDGPVCALLGCNPDLDLFVPRAQKPTLTARDCSAETSSSGESCSVANPAADWYCVGVYTYVGSAASFSVRATY